MENCEENDNSSVRLSLRRHPRRFCIPNKAAQRLPIKGDLEATGKLESLLKSNIGKVIKTPAQDRLKRLQHNLRSKDHKNQATRIIRQPKNLDANSVREQESSPKDDPFVSSSIVVVNKSPKGALNSSLTTQDVNNGETTKTSSIDGAKNFKFSESPTNSSKEFSKTGTEPTSSLKSLATSNLSQSIENDYSSIFSNLRTEIFKKFVEFWKIPFNVSKKLTRYKSPAKVVKSSSTSSPNTNKSPKRMRQSQQHMPTSLQDRRADIDTFVDKKSAMRRPSLMSTHENINVPSYSRSSANLRLERLKQSLLLKQQQEKQSRSSANNLESSARYPEHNTSNTSENIEIMVHNNSTSSLEHTANNTINDDAVEAMDWQPISMDEKQYEVLNSCSSSVIEKSKKSPDLPKDGNDNQTMGDIYDTVNENMLRYSAEKQESVINSNKWRTNFYYFILDTNVLLKELTFVEDLTRMKLCDTKGSILFIPYTVLHELDKLKMRSGAQEGVKTLAIRAIKYLNGKFEHNPSHIQAQSALDERRYLIEVNSPDDSIINSCLQVKKYVPNLLLLTEDVNLRNKAICNNILVSTKSDLLSKRYDIL